MSLLLPLTGESASDGAHLDDRFHGEGREKRLQLSISIWRGDERHVLPPNGPTRTHRHMAETKVGSAS